MTKGLRTAEERLETEGGVTIFVRSWRPDAPARGVVVIVHGFNSHSGEYGWVASQFAGGSVSAYVAPVGDSDPAVRALP